MRSAYSLLLAGWFIFGCISIFCFEKIPLNNGLGFDGKIYGAIAENFPGIVQQHQLSSYYTQRLLPSAIVNLFLRAVHIPLTDHSVVIAFCFLNLVCILLCMILWNAIAGKYNLSFPSRLFGYISLLIIFPVLKDAFFDPVATDYSALLLGFAMLWFYLQKKEILLFLCIVAGYFTWPAAFYGGAILFIFCKTEEKQGERTIDIRNLFFTGCMALLAASLIYGLGFADRYKPNTKYAINMYLIWISVPVVSVYLWMISRLPVLKNFPVITARYKREIIKTCLLILLFFSLGYVVNTFSDATQYSVSPASVVLLSFLRSVERPFIFLTGHFAYFGPLIIFLLVYRKEVAENMQPDRGLQLFFLFHLTLAINSESRFIMLGVPVFILYASRMAEKIQIRKSFLLLFFLIALLVSKIWLPFTAGLNAENWSTSSFTYYSVFGPWMSTFWYCLQLGFMILSFFIFIRMKRSALSSPQLS